MRVIFIVMFMGRSEGENWRLLKVKEEESKELEGPFKSYDSLCLGLDICVKCVCYMHVSKMYVKVCVEFVVGDKQILHQADL